MYHIYKFLDCNNKVLYVGYTSNIQIRMREQHFAGHTHLTQNEINNVCTVEYTSFENQFEALFNEKYYIDLYKPPYNTTLYQDYDINDFKTNNDWCFYCSTSTGKITKTCDVGNTCKNTRTSIVLNKELKKEIENLALKDNRSFNNYIITVLENHLKPTEK